MAKSLRRQKILLERELARLINIGMYEKIEAKYELKNKEAQNIKQFTGFPDKQIKDYYNSKIIAGPILMGFPNDINFRLSN